MFRFGFALAVWSLGLGQVTAASAQRVSGRLLDRESAEPIVAGLVTLVARNGAQVATSTSDELGQWHIAVPVPGTYFLSAKRIGYQPWTSAPVDVKERDDVTMVFHLRRAAVTLHPIEVSARAMRAYLDRAGFYERQRSDFGHFITPEDIEKRRAVRVTDLLVAVPGVRLVRMTTGSAGPLFVELRGSNISDGGVCRPRVFVDGVLFARGDSRPARAERNASVERRVEDVLQRLDQGLSLDDIGHPSTIAAIEVYRSATQVPVQFGGTSVATLCGAIVIWTKTGTRRTDP
jgi:Carboxypeptidase regulatory-like domain/TonB-dependent Receptor Plug Domain